jgi:DNA polymerase-3 subunit delta'
MLMPETLSLALGWPLDEKTQDELDAKKRKPSKEIKVDAAREAVSFTQFTRSRGTTKVVLVFPAERMNNVTANTLLKTLEEPPGAVKFILATEAAHQLLPTIRSRCLGHTMVWPDFELALGWLQQEISNAGEGTATGKKAAPRPSPPTCKPCWSPRAGARPMRWPGRKAARRAKPPSIGRPCPKPWRAATSAPCRTGRPRRRSTPCKSFATTCWPCAWAPRRGFSTPATSPRRCRRAGKAGGGLYALAAWSRELATTARTVEHPYNPGLMLESLVSRARLALNTK